MKWLKEIRLSEEEAHGTWQRGMAYKVLPIKSVGSEQECIVG